MTKAIIATFSEGNPQHGVIIDWAREPWAATKQYENEALSFILFDLAEDEEPVEVLNFGPMSSHTFNVTPNQVTCYRTYQEALIETKKVEAE